MKHDVAANHRAGVAIVGMACLFPGAPDVDAYWRNILGKVDSTSEPPPQAWDPDVYYDPAFSDEDQTYCQRGGYLGDLAAFEPLAHGIPPIAVGGEPDQWLALQVAHDALADAGALDLADDVRARTEIILGKGTYLNGGNAIAVQRGLVVGQTIDLIRQLHPEHSEANLEQLREELKRTLPALGPDTVPGLIPNIIVGRIANRLDLMGPAYTVDAACASSLIAVQHALRDLVAGDCDLALAGGSQVWMPVATMNLFCRLGALSRHQQLRPFDQDADGTLLGEGIGIVVLKRVADAVRDADRIYAVIRGVGVASDGRGVSVMAPRIDGEEMALRRAYADAGVSPRSVGLVEAHGTGTPVGDVVEVQALTRVFGERGNALPHCALGSVKSMISHTIPAAGVASLIKTALALHHRILPPTLHCDQPNPKLELERSPFYLNTETRPWIHGGPEPRRAGINAFGFGGINAHAVLEEFGGQCAGGHRPPWETEVCILEGDSPQALADQAGALADALDTGPQFTLAELAFTLGRELGELGSVSRPRRLAVVASSLEDLRQKLGVAIEKLSDSGCRRIKTMGGIYYESEPLGPDGKVVVVFPGEGAQYPNMLAELCLQFPEAREVFDRIDRLYADHPRGHRLSDWVFPRPAFSDAERRYTDERLMDMDVAVESVLTANAAVHAVIKRLVPRVDAILGHSTGEHYAAMAAGALDVQNDEDLATFSYGLNASYTDATSRHEVPGAVLLAVGTDAAGAREIAAQAGGELYLAMDNCPHQAVLVGEVAAVSRAREIATGNGFMCEQLPYDRAVHTPRFAPFAEDLRGIFAKLPVRTAEAGLWSCTTAAPYPDDPAAIRELLIEHWTSPVRFRETIEALYEDGARVFVEAGPRGNMTSFIEDILRRRPFCAVAADSLRRCGVTQLNHLAAMLAAHVVDVDVGYLFEQRPTKLIDWRNPAPSEPAPPAKIPLSTVWPALRLPEAALKRLRPAPAPAAGSSNGRAVAHGQPGLQQAAAPPATWVDPVSHGHPGNGHACNGHTSNGHASDGHAIAPSPTASAAPIAPPAAPTPSFAESPDDAAVALEGHLQTMELFLQTGADVMQAYLGGGVAVVIEQARRPLIGTIVNWQSAVELVARRTIDCAEDLYLRHHTLGHTVSRADPELTALAVVPLAMSIEVLAEAAACLLPDRLVTGLRDVRAHRWITVGETPTTIEVRARRLASDGSTDRVHVELYEPDQGGSAAPVVEGVVLLGGGFAPAPAAIEVPLAGGRPCRWDPADLYGEAMFHQPLWQGVQAMDVVAPAGARARLKVLPRAGLLRGNDAPEFVLDPVALDAAGQVVGFWSVDRLERGSAVFPFRLAALDLYGPPRPVGEQLECRAAIALAGEHFVRSDIDVLDDDGRCWMRLQAWEDKRFDVPDRFRALTLASAPLALSSPWVAPVAPYRGLSVACRRLDTQLGPDSALWKQVWAGRVLGRRERALFAALTVPPGRQLEWLAARTAAKEAVAELLRVAVGVDLLSAEIEILPDERGCPIVSVPLEDLDVVPIVSLTHTQGEAAALAALVPALGHGGVGIDIELLRPRPAGFAEAALTAPERQLLEPLAGAEAEQWVLRCWCAKEAAGKAGGLGLTPGRPGAPRVTALHFAGGRVLVDVGGRVLAVHTQREGSLMIATTIGEEAETE